jgi:hypothetical protein
MHGVTEDRTDQLLVAGILAGMVVVLSLLFVVLSMQLPDASRVISSPVVDDGAVRGVAQPAAPATAIDAHTRAALARTGEVSS